MQIKDALSYFLSVVTIILTLIVFVSSADAQTGNQAIPVPISPLAPSPQGERQEVTTFIRPLNELRAETGPMRLRNASARAELSYAVSPRLLLDRAVLELDFTNSISLLESRSQLLVRNNGTIVAQLTLEADNPSKLASIQLPVDTFEAGYNKLTFEVAQHYTLQCEDPTAPELWTEINTVRSRLIFAGTLDTENLLLSELNDLMGPGFGNSLAYDLTVGVNELAEQHLQWGNEIAQALAVRLDYVVPQLRSLTAEPFPARAAAPNADGTASPLATPAFNLAAASDRNVVLYGPRSEISPFLPADVRSAITGPFVGVYALDQAPGQFALVISGVTPEEVSQAVRSFTHYNFPYVDAPQMVVTGITPPAETAGNRLAPIMPDTTYSFLDLGAASDTLSFAGPEAKTVFFDVPSDFYVKESDSLEVDLDFTYGAGFREDSVLNIVLNGRFQKAIPLNDPEGASLRDYQLFLPARLLTPGPNTLTFAPVMLSNAAGECLPFQDGNLMVTILDRSELTFPPAESYVHQPDLDIFRRSGFPYTGDLEGEATTLVVAGRDKLTATAAFLLSAKLAQTHGRVMTDMAVRYAPEGEDIGRNLLVVGTLDEIDPRYLEDAPIASGETLRLAYADTGETGPRFADLWSDFNAAYDNARGREKNFKGTTTSLSMEQEASLGRNAVLMAYRSPFSNKERTVTVATAETTAALSAGIQQLMEPALWGQLAGDLNLWRPGSEFVYSQQAGDLYYMGSAKPMSFLRYHLARAPFWWIFGALAVVLLLAWVIHRMVTSRASAYEDEA